MKLIKGFLFSSSFTGLILIIFAFSIGFATFIENDLGSESSRFLIYNAHWFEVLLLLGLINLTGQIIIKKLYKKEKLSIFVFHFSFILIIVGAGITRYSGLEGSMSIREGHFSNQFLTYQTFIQAAFKNSNKPEIHNFKVDLSPLGNKRLRRNIKYRDKKITIYLKYGINNAIENIASYKSGKPIAEFLYADSSGRHSLNIESGEIKSIGKIKLAFDTLSNDSSVINLISLKDSIALVSKIPGNMTNMNGSSFIQLDTGKIYKLKEGRLYSFSDNVLVLNKYLNKGKRTASYYPGSDRETYYALWIELNCGNNKKEILLFGKKGNEGKSEEIKLGDINMVLSYGSIRKTIPFDLILDDFIIKRYPGSVSPSSFESYIKVIDNQNNKIFDHKIFMNNILKYRGYRFYQSSYDSDEKGTVLSVNKDMAGTSVTYSGYILLTIGIIASLFNKTSRLHKLSRDTRELIIKRKSIPLIFLFLICGFLYNLQAQTKTDFKPVNEKHAQKFGKLLVQDNNGRIKPINTLSSEILRKLYGKNHYRNLTSDQVFLGMIVDPSIWQHEKILKVTNQKIQEFLGSSEEYYSFSSFFRENQYLLDELVNNAFRKSPSERSKFDNEIIRLNERINICFLVFSGEILKIFPLENDSTYTWYNHEGIIGKANGRDSTFVENILFLYIQDIQKSLVNNDWRNPNDIIEAISAYQVRYGSEVIPSDKKIKAEIFLNRSECFARIANYYGIAGFILLIVQFINLFYSRLKLKHLIKACIVLIISVFLLHSIALGLRWYVAGHVPLSNGYETLTYVAWCGLLAGIILSGRSKFTLSITPILAFIILKIAQLSWMDPQITNLVPVLKSYWLLLHVSIITSSYAFLIIGALIAYLNLLLIIAYGKSVNERLKLIIYELSNTIEMALIIGLYLLTIGVFLGAVWANESWGRYWGWDPKETWALITMLVYVFVLHMRKIPGLKSLITFNLISLLSVGSVIMTYFGVNYYLAGLHSYAKGDPKPFPVFAFYIIAIIIITAFLAYFRNPLKKAQR